MWQFLSIYSHICLVNQTPIVFIFGKRTFLEIALKLGQPPKMTRFSGALKKSCGSNEVPIFGSVSPDMIYQNFIFFGFPWSSLCLFCDQFLLAFVFDRSLVPKIFIVDIKKETFWSCFDFFLSLRHSFWRGNFCTNRSSWFVNSLPFFLLAFVVYNRQITDCFDLLSSAFFFVFCSFEHLLCYHFIGSKQ